MHIRQGFTLIEMTITMVIIALLLGGVLIGRDLLKNAQARAAISQWEKYNSAVATFDTTYNGLPGDLDDAAKYGFTAADTAPSSIPGDRRLTCNGSGGVDVTTRALGFETALFWQHLLVAQLIGGNMTAAGSSLATGVTSAAMPNYLPRAEIGSDNYFTVFSAVGRNYYQIAGVTSTADITANFTLANALTPYEAFSFDSKVDDGTPMQGAVQAMQSVTDLNTAAVLGDTCVTGTSLYQLATNAAGETPACQLRLDFK